MSDDRDQLGELLHQKITDRLPALPTKRVIGEYVDAAISTAIKAGYRKPRQVTTVEELDALPIGSVVLSESYTHYLDGMRIAFQKWNDEAWHRYGRASETHPVNFLPAKVLHVGGAE